MKAKEYVENKHGDNDWKYYPPSKETVIEWLEDYANKKNKDISIQLESIRWRLHESAKSWSKLHSQLENCEQRYVTLRNRYMELKHR